MGTDPTVEIYDYAMDFLQMVNIHRSLELSDVIVGTDLWLRAARMNRMHIDNLQSEGVGAW